MPSRRILIVGGGIAGLALGRALREQGVVPEIIERAPSWPTHGTGLYLPGNGVRAEGRLDRDVTSQLGVLSDVQYQEGLVRKRGAAEAAEARGEILYLSAGCNPAPCPPRSA